VEKEIGKRVFVTHTPPIFVSFFFLKSAHRGRKEKGGKRMV
jgi:hypothetical protein